MAGRSKSKGGKRSKRGAGKRTASKRGAKRGAKPGTRRTSGTGRVYEKRAGTKTGWVQISAHRRTKPTRKATPAEKRVHSCSHTRRKKQMGPKRRGS